MDSASGAAFFLAVIAVADGLRLLPKGGGAIVLSQSPMGGWSVTHAEDADAPGPRLRLVTWCSPVLLPVVLAQGTGGPPPLETRRSVTLFRARLRRARRWIAALRVGGALTLVALVAGVPYLTARVGAWGLIAGVALVLLLSLAQALAGLFALRRAGMRCSGAVFTAARFLWPFSAPRAAEETMRQVAAGMPPLVLLHELLSPRAFAQYARPALYDAVVRGVEDHDVRTLRDHMGPERVTAVLRQPPDPAEGDAFCPRCGTCFVGVARRCSDCAGIDLVPQPSR